MGRSIENLDLCSHLPPECGKRDNQPFYPLSVGDFESLRVNDSTVVTYPGGFDVQIDVLDLDGEIVYRHKCLGGCDLDDFFS